MSQPSTCPFCGAATEYTSAYHTGYKCWTLIRDGQKDPRESQSFLCVRAERDQLLAQNRELVEALEVLLCGAEKVQSKGYAFAQLDAGVAMARAVLGKSKEAKP